jgi:hypothetical protein
MCLVIDVEPGFMHAGIFQCMQTAGLLYSAAVRVVADNQSDITFNFTDLVIVSLTSLLEMQENKLSST